MTDWLEEVEQRRPLSLSDGTPFVALTVTERLRLVRFVRGVRKLAAMWEQEGVRHKGANQAEYNTVDYICGETLPRLAAELRNLEAEDDK